MSQHSYGNAIDINTYENPYVAGGIGCPKGSNTYVNRKNHRKGMIIKGGTVESRFRAMGWPCGGPLERARPPALLLERRVRIVTRMQSLRAGRATEATTEAIGKANLPSAASLGTGLRAHAEDADGFVPLG